MTARWPPRRACSRCPRPRRTPSTRPPSPTSGSGSVPPDSASRTASGSVPPDQDLAAEAIRLGRALAELMPDEPEVQGVLAMMLLHDARRAARFDDGDLVLLADQDRGLWDRAQIEDGRTVLDRALALHGRGPYVIQAAIAALHTDQARDWPQIASLYAELHRLTGSPVVEFSRAVAVAEHQGPLAGPRPKVFDFTGDAHS